MFGTSKRSENHYVTAGVRLTHRLVQSLQLADWQKALPTTYTPEEASAIDEALSSFQRIADRTVGGKAVFHPEIVEPIQRMQKAQALQDLAGRGWGFSEKSELPADWKVRVSTYLKAWACHPNPDALLEMAEMLAKAGYKTEAKEAFEVVLLFPRYAHTFLKRVERISEFVSSIVNRAQDGLRNL
jgi:hypothetical protein